MHCFYHSAKNMEQTLLKQTIEKSILKIEFLYIFDWNMFENLIFEIEFSILLGLFPHYNLYRLTFQSFVLRENFPNLSKKLSIKNSMGWCSAYVKSELFLNIFLTFTTIKYLNWI